MIIVDSCGWLEWFADGELAGEFEPYLADQENLLIPVIVLCEMRTNPDYGFRLKDRRNDG